MALHQNRENMRPPHFPCNCGALAMQRMPDYNYHYEIPEADLEVIACSSALGSCWLNVPSTNAS